MRPVDRRSVQLLHSATRTLSQHRHRQPRTVESRILDSAAFSSPAIERIPIVPTSAASSRAVHRTVPYRARAIECPIALPASAHGTLGQRIEWLVDADSARPTNVGVVCG